MPVIDNKGKVTTGPDGKPIYNGFNSETLDAIAQNPDLLRDLNTFLKSGGRFIAVEKSGVGGVFIAEHNIIALLAAQNLNLRKATAGIGPDPGCYFGWPSKVLDVSRDSILFHDKPNIV